LGNKRYHDENHIHLGGAVCSNQGSMSKKKILLVDDSADITMLYHALLCDEPDLECVGELASADQLLSTVERLQPEVVLLDLGMPGIQPLEIVAQLSEKYPDVRVIIFSGYDDPQTVNSVLDAGAWGLISKNGEPSTVVATIRKVLAGEIAVPTRIA
jgi:DNA-binding NarL/FixJ family response regulator